MATDRSDQLGDRVHERFLIFLELGVVRYTPTVLHTDNIAHGVVHVHYGVEKGRLEVGWGDAMCHTEFAQLPQKNFEANHGLSEVSPVERVNAVGPNHTSLDLNLAQSSAIDWLAGEKASLIDGFG